MNKYSLVSMRRCTVYNYSNIISVLVFYISFDLRIRSVEKVVTTIRAQLLTNEKDHRDKSAISRL